MRCLLIVVCTGLILTACGDKKRKYFVTVININGENTKDSISVTSDSAAYWDGIFAYTASLQVYNTFKEKQIAEHMSKPIGFEVIDEKGVDIETRLPAAVKAEGAKYISSKIDTEIPGVSLSTSNEVNEIPLVDPSIIKELSRSATFKEDEFKGITWVQPKSKPRYRNANGIYCYFAKKGNQVLNFRLVIQYYADDWLFIKNYRFVIDGQPYSFYPANVERDNGDGYIWEWSDEIITSADLSLIQALVEAKKAKIRFEGSNYYYDKVITASQLKSIKQMYQLYLASGGQF